MIDHVELNRAHAAHCPSEAQRWDIFCKVVDNFGDIGVCWRLVRQLASEYRLQVKLWVDDLTSFACLCPSVSIDQKTQSVGPVQIQHWTDEIPPVDVADVVIEAFGCDLPSGYIEKMAQKNPAPVWINLEYLSAEPWVEECHQLASPHPDFPLKKHFFFPGLTSNTGGVLREKDLLTQQDSFDAAATEKFWTSLNIPAPAVNEIRISLFCYENQKFPELMESIQGGPIQISLMVSPGAATRQVSHWLGHTLGPGESIQKGAATIYGLPFFRQEDYDQLLWACDVNFVRGEDSFVRAQWARRPFVWQIYPQAENAHLVKLEWFLKRYLNEFPQPDVITRLWMSWNNGGDLGSALREYLAIRPSIESHGKVWAGQLDRTGNLTDNLVRFVRGQGIISTAYVAGAS